MRDFQGRSGPISDLVSFFIAIRKIFIKYLNSNGVQCTALKELWDTEEIAGFIHQKPC